MFAPTDFVNWTMDSDWLNRYNLSRAEAEIIADRIHLIHVTAANLARLLLSPPPCLLETDELSGRSSKNTVETEDMLGLGRCLYFYVGRAYPVAGGAAIAFNKECEKGHTGSATPYDTGGLRLGHIHTNLRDGQLADFCHECMKPLDKWREDFGKFLAAYFSPLTAYWSEGPDRRDAAGIFLNGANSWRSWTYEIRFNEAHDIVAGIEAWCVSDAQWTLYSDELENASPADVDSLSAFLSTSLNEDTGMTNYGEVIEQWVREKVGLRP